MMSMRTARGSWVLLEPTAGGGEAEGDALEAPEASGSV